MPNLRDVRNLLLLSHYEDIIDDDEFMLLYELVKPRNRDLPYWTYAPFDLEKLSDDECLEEFRFLRSDIYIIRELLAIPEEFVCYNGTKVYAIEGLCIYLKRFAYPCRYSDTVYRFGRSVQELSLISNFVMNYIYTNHSWRFTSLNQPWLSPACLERFCRIIQNAGAPIANCWGFIDGTVLPVCRPGQFQRIIYNGHKRVHAMKYQSVVTPNGMIANLFGPIEGRRHDSGMLRDSNLLDELSLFSFSTIREPLCICGDSAYPLRFHLQGPFRRGVQLTQEQLAYNTAMSKLRVAVEWVFGDIKTYFAFLDFKKKLKIGLSAVGKM